MKGADQVISRLPILALVLSLAGCTVTSPDGVSFRKGAPQAEVRARLGEPDFAEEFDEVPGVLAGHPPGVNLYYLNRGYSAALFTWGLSHFYAFNPEARGELDRKRKIYREIVPLVPVRGTPADVVAALGPPDLVEREFPRGFFYSQLYGAPAWPPTRSISYIYPDRELRVVFENDQVKRAIPGTTDWVPKARRTVEILRKRAALAAEDPPRAGMDGPAVKERWGAPPVVSVAVRGHEVLTVPDEAAERLGTEITCWYYPAVDAAARLSGGRVVSVEPLAAERKRAITTFLERAESISTRIGRPAEQRLD